MTQRNGTPAQLRQKAKDLLAQADRLEEQQMIKVGRLVMKHYEGAFKGFDTEKFRKEIEEVLS
ncbi:MAG: hypothetical protein GXY80_15390 [Syntrophorhabdus aromaticivorans]|uniref:Uncharacterized protein n=1 Tax=Syntrophorhabdus aromaticivorans TaxID=328301 RepID=A0A351U5X2_9BACT|nr:hypothetical protein [Syntrophorhabdus aromaticivorans]HBA55353.1 hypothetical protein [Syntrophorhabdus aromaticivorans]